MKHSISTAWIFPLQLSEQCFCIFPFCMSIYGTQIFTYRKLILVLKPNHIGFPDIDHWPDKGQASFVPISFRRKRIKSAFIEQGQHHRLNHIVFVVGISNLITSQLKSSLIQSAFPHFCTERTGVRFLANLK